MHCPCIFLKRKNESYYLQNTKYLQIIVIKSIYFLKLLFKNLFWVVLFDQFLRLSEQKRDLFYKNNPSENCIILSCRKNKLKWSKKLMIVNWFEKQFWKDNKIWWKQSKHIVFFCALYHNISEIMSLCTSSFLQAHLSFMVEILAFPLSIQFSRYLVVLISGQLICCFKQVMKKVLKAF